MKKLVSLVLALCLLLSVAVVAHAEDKVVINLTDVGITPRDIEGTTLNITVDRIHDLHGNT